ncbi:MAG: hypothetical protein J6X27_05355 [Bacteroidaceae bacterium]|nr:hypothetical protein [Bacteroidaceae bacterium]
MKRTIFFILLIGLVGRTGAQDLTTTVEPVNPPRHKPKMMVIPFTKEGEDIRTVLEDDINKRVVLTKIKEAFDKRGYTTVDFFGRVKGLSVTQGLGMNQQQDYKTLIIQGSGADVYIEAEIYVQDSPTGNGVKVILTAYEISSGNSLANAVGESGKFYTDDYGKLAIKAVETSVDDFLGTLQSKFYDIMDNGASINITIGIDNSSDWLLSNEVGNDGYTLADMIELWMAENAYHGDYHLQGVTDLQMIFDDVHIPLNDEDGRPYNVQKFGLKMLSFFRDLGIKIERTRGSNTLVITIK